MMRSLYSGVSGLKVHQTKMDVIGNNISNVNTVGFKASTVTFSDVLYQTTQSATGPNEETGRAGQNAKQIGLGANLASITAAMSTSGGSQRTDNPFDVMIEGDGFFVVNNGTSNYFTKAGSFTVDANGTLCTAAGYSVMGWQVDPSDPTKTAADNVSPLRIMSPENMYSEPEATSEVSFSGNIDSADTQLATGRATNFTFFDNLGQSYTVKLKLTQQVDAAQALISNKYNVEITDVLDANGKSIFVTETTTAGATTYAKSTVDSVTLGGCTFTPTVDATDGTVTLTAGGDAPILQFDARSGKFSGIGADGDTTESVSFYFTLQDTTHPLPDNTSNKAINVDFSELTMFANSGKTTIEGNKGDADGNGRGRSAGNMSGISIDTAGKIYGTYDNGVSKLLGQIVIAKFANVSGLEAVGNSLFAETQNSGEFDGIGEDITQSGGKFNVGVLEMSNVDLAGQFTDMITTQRGFQANSRIITTSDTLLEELINLKR